jgi:hypothetical protein
MLDLPAGIALNIAVASHVMGYTLDYEFDDLHGAPTVPALRDGADEWGLLPDFSRDWNCIKLIAEKLREGRFMLSTNMSADGYGATFRRDWSECAISPPMYATCYREDLAHAVCLAALDAVGVKELTV